VQTCALPILVRRTRRHLPPDLLAAVLDALIATWAPRQPGARDLRLLVEGRGEAAEDLHFAGPVVRIGSADSCHLKLDATDTAAEACELRRTESGWSVRPLTEEGFTLNGEPLQLKIDTPLSVQDQLEIGPVVCTIEAGDPPASM